MAGYTGEALRAAVATAQSEQPALIEDFLYERDVLMMAADPGAGKSLLITQLALALTTAAPVYDFFTVPAPRNTYYIQLEGKPEQAFERIRRMETKLTWDPAKLCWDARKGLNVLDPRQIEGVLNDIAGWQKPDLVVIDPIYKAVFAPLAEEQAAQALIRFSDLLQQHFSCAVVFVHHTHREKYGIDGKRIAEDDPFFGSQWLKAHVDTAYVLKHAGGKYKDRVTLSNKKSRGGDVVSEVLLHYDPESDTVSTEAPPEKQSGYERVLKYLQELRKQGKTTHIFEVMEVCHLSMRHVRRVQMALLRNGHLKCDKSVDNKRLWEPQGKV